MPEELPFPSAQAMRSHVLDSLSRYWPRRSDTVAALPVRDLGRRSIVVPLALQRVALPKWASECGVNGELLVPIEACADSDDWTQVDWWLAAFLLLECWHERVWEQRHGPIHSYSVHLNGWDERAWQHAWVNRVGMFLRLWAAREGHENASALSGPLPDAEFLMTHDVDAIRKTMAIRVKQGLFILFNAGRVLIHGNVAGATERLGHALRFLFGNEDWWKLDELVELESGAGVRSVFHFYAVPGARSAKLWLFDPGYDVGQPRVRSFIESLSRNGFVAGLHPGFDTWRNSEAIAAQHGYMETGAGRTAIHCRQHWLRFSWQHTWRAQADAGLKYDTTLMFNDRPGFRNSSAIAWHPWDAEKASPHGITAQPTVLMDSHFYDYSRLNAEERRRAIDAWLAEVRSVSGQAAMLWHPHTLTHDYGWAEGFKYLLGATAGNCRCPD